MEYEMQPYIVYVKLDDANRITAVNSSAFLKDTDGWIEHDRGYGDKYHHAQGNFLRKPITDERGVYRYEYDPETRTIYERTQEEMDADYAARPATPPSDADRLKALEAQLSAYEAAYAEGVNEA